MAAQSLAEIREDWQERSSVGLAREIAVGPKTV
jgi:hypothetical protein